VARTLSRDDVNSRTQARPGVDALASMQIPVTLDRWFARYSVREYVQSCRTLTRAGGRTAQLVARRGPRDHTLSPCGRGSPRSGGVRGAAGIPYPTKAPLTPTLSHARSRLWHASRCARGEGAHRVRGTAVPNRNQAYSIRAECALGMVPKVPTIGGARAQMREAVGRKRHHDPTWPPPGLYQVCYFCAPARVFFLQTTTIGKGHR
jgi:hypothetical protein